MKAAGSGSEHDPAPPAAVHSRSHRLRMLGRPMPVERIAGASYARFTMTGSVVLEIEVAAAIGDSTSFPAWRVTSTEADGNILTVRLDAPEPVVIWIDRLEPLFLLPDPIELPVHLSPNVLDVGDFGADPTGRTLATRSIQAAIDEAAGHAAGGVVVLPRGLFRSGTLVLKSHVNLHLAAGAVLQGSTDPADYPLDPGRRESASDAGLPPDVRYLGRTMTFSRLLLVDDADNVRISGRGTIDGRGAYLRTVRNIAPNLLRIRDSTNVVVEDVLFRDAAAWSVHVLASRDVTIRNVKVVNPRTTLNTDGIDLDMSTDVTVDRSFIYTKDDAICVKATRNSDRSGDPARIVVSRNLVSAVDAGLKLGSESDAASFSDIVFEDNHVFATGRAMSVVVRDGATYERVTFRGVDVGPDVDHLVEQVIGVRDPATGLGVIRDLAFEDVRAPTFQVPASNWTWYAQYRPSRPARGDDVPVFEGADDSHAVTRLRFKAVVVNGAHLDDEPTARRVANLTIGPHVRDVTFE